MVIFGNDDTRGITGLRLAAASPTPTSEPLAALATIVRTLGVIGGVDHADRAALEAWARHVEDGTAAPGARRRAAPARRTAADHDAARRDDQRDDQRDEQRDDQRDDQRDWAGLCGAVTRSLEHRAACCARTVEDLQTKLAVAQHDRREQEDRDVMDDLLIREHARLLARAADRAADRNDARALSALVHDTTTKLMILLDERCGRRNQRALDDLDDGALVDEFDGLDDEEPTVPALRSPLVSADRPAIVRWRQ